MNEMRVFKQTNEQNENNSLGRFFFSKCELYEKRRREQIKDLINDKTRHRNTGNIHSENVTLFQGPQLPLIIINGVNWTVLWGFLSHSHFLENPLLS